MASGAGISSCVIVKNVKGVGVILSDNLIIMEMDYIV